MPTFVARVRDTRGKFSVQKIVAESLAQARTTLRQQGFFVQELKQSQSFSLAANLNLKDINTKLATVTVRDKAVFSRQFAALVNAGVAIVRGLGVLSEQCSNPKLRAALLDISADVQSGVNLSD